MVMVLPKQAGPEGQAVAGVSVAHRLNEAALLVERLRDQIEQVEAALERAVRGGDGCSAPPRLNGAGVCGWCLEQGCTAERCELFHARSAWMVCENCWGHQRDGHKACYCWSGMIPTGLVSGPGVDAWEALRLPGPLGRWAVICWCERVDCWSPDCDMNSVKADDWYGAPQWAHKRTGARR
jgi:hypothetical protein